jgi:beta-glucanase (GH16 family)
MYPNRQQALTLLGDATARIAQATAILTPSISVSSPVKGVSIVAGDLITLSGAVTGDIVRVRVYDKNATVLGDAVPDADTGLFSVSLDTSPLKPDARTWFTATGYNSATQDTGIVQSSVDLSVVAPGGEATPPPVEDPYAGTLAEGMALVFEDTFGGTALDLAKWFVGPKPRGLGGQWGGAHFVTKDEAAFKDVYVVADGVLSVRAFHDEAYQDPEGWGRKWKAGQLSTATPEEIIGGFRQGYAEVSMKLPASVGAWSGFCLYNTYDNTGNVSDPGGSELDNEFYGDAKALVAYTVHDWPGNTGRTPMKDGGTDFYTDGMPDTTTQQVVYGIEVTATEVVNYVNGRETKRYPLPPTPGGDFYVTLDLAIQENHAVDLPGASGYVALDIDYVRIFKKA